jgi:biopolymer transport protein ExbB
MEFFYPVVRFFTAGGAFMFPILLVGAVAVAITIERYVTLSRMGASNRRTWGRVESVLTSGDFDKARELLSKDDSGLSRLLSMGLALQGAVRRRDDVEKAMQEGMMEIVPQLEKRTHYLATAANVATLLGLLGTVSGLIHAFGAVATVNPAEKANLLAASISEAMNCTAFGLAVAIPALVAFSVLQGRTQMMMDDVNESAVGLLNLILANRDKMKLSVSISAAAPEEVEA